MTPESSFSNATDNYVDAVCDIHFPCSVLFLQDLIPALVQFEIMYCTGILKWDAGILSRVLTTMPNAYANVNFFSYL